MERVILEIKSERRKRDGQGEIRGENRENYMCEREMDM